MVEAEAATADFAQTAPVASSYKSDLVEKLPLNRGLEQTLTLAPGVNATGPARGTGATARAAITISGAMSFENLFTVNGVVVNENLRGMPLDLFIEDALQETTITSGAVSAEFGRFAGGVVQAITKSGGNDFSGSFRTTFRNDDWRSTLPLNDRKVDRIVPVYEGDARRPAREGQAVVLRSGPAPRRHAQQPDLHDARQLRPRGQAAPLRGQAHLVADPRPHAARGLPEDQRGDAERRVHARSWTRTACTGSAATRRTCSPSTTRACSRRSSSWRRSTRGATSPSAAAARSSRTSCAGRCCIDRSRGPNARYNAPTFCAVCGRPRAARQRQRAGEGDLLRVHREPRLAPDRRRRRHLQRPPLRRQLPVGQRLPHLRHVGHPAGRRHLPRVRERRIDVRALEPDLRATARARASGRTRRS